MDTRVYRCHSGFVPLHRCSGGTYLLVVMFHRNKFASVDVPPGTFAHSRRRSGPRKRSASARVVVKISVKASFMHFSLNENGGG